MVVTLGKATAAFQLMCTSPSLPVSFCYLTAQTSPFSNNTNVRFCCNGEVQLNTNCGLRLQCCD